MSECIGKVGLMRAALKSRHRGRRLRWCARARASGASWFT